MAESQAEEYCSRLQKERERADELLSELRIDRNKLKSDLASLTDNFTEKSTELEKYKRDYNKTSSQKNLMKVKLASVKGLMIVFKAERQSEILYYEDHVSKLESELYQLRKIKNSLGDDYEPQDEKTAEVKLEGNPDLFKISLLDFSSLLESENQGKELLSPSNKLEDSFEDRISKSKAPVLEFDSVIQFQKLIPQSRQTINKEHQRRQSHHHLSPQQNATITQNLSSDSIQAEQIYKDLAEKYEHNFQIQTLLTQRLQSNLDQQNKVIKSQKTRLEVQEKSLADKDADLNIGLIELAKVKLEYAYSMNQLERYIKQEKNAQRMHTISESSLPLANGSVSRRTSIVPDPIPSAESQDHLSRPTQLFARWFN